MDTYTTGWDLNAERELWRHLCYESFYHFCLIAFGFGNHPDGSWFTERIHKPLCDWVQGHTEAWFVRRAQKKQGRMRLMIVVPRTHGKTWTVTKAHQAWLHLRDHNIATVTDSEETTKAQEFMRSILEVISGNEPYALFTWLYGNWKDTNRQWQAAQAVHALRTSLSKTEPSFGTCSVASGKTGYHPDVVYLDDPVSYEKLRESGAWNDQCNTHVAALVPVIKSNGAFVVVGTRYLDDDPIGRLMRSEGVNEVAGMPMLDERVSIDPKGLWSVYFLQAELGTDDEGMPIPLLPEAWNADELLAYKRSRPIHYASQMMNEPSTGEHNPITQELIQRLYVEREEIPRHMTLTVHCDTAFRYSKRVARSDSSVIQVWGHSMTGDGSVYYLFGCGSQRWTAEKFTEKLVEVCQRYILQGYRIRAVTDELEMGGKEGMYKHFLQNAFNTKGLNPPPIVMIRRFGGTGNRKIDRILDASNYWLDGKVYLVKNAPGVQELVSQMTRIGVSAHDDWADAAADVFDPSVYYVARNVSTHVGEQDYHPMRPYDEILQGGRVAPAPGSDDREAVAAYDAFYRPDEEDWQPARIPIHLD